MPRKPYSISKMVERLGRLDDKTYSRVQKKLVRIGSAAVDPLIDALSDSEPKMRYRSVWTLGIIADPRAFESVLTCTKDEDEGVAYDAILVLGKLKDPRAIAPLLAILTDENDDDDNCLPGVAVNALADIGLDAVPSLLKLTESGSSLIRGRAVSALGGIGSDDPEVISKLTSLLRDTDRTVKINVIEALLEINGRLSKEALDIIEQSDDDELRSYLLKCQLAA